MEVEIHLRIQERMLYLEDTEDCGRYEDKDTSDAGREDDLPIVSRVTQG